MRKSKRIVVALCALAVLAIGLLCLNYTKATTLDHHEEWAAGHDMPEPGPGILGIGVAAVALGSGMLGFAIGRR